MDQAQASPYSAGGQAANAAAGCPAVVQPGRPSAPQWLARRRIPKPHAAYRRRPKGRLFRGGLFPLSGQATGACHGWRAAGQRTRPLKFLQQQVDHHPSARITPQIGSSSSVSLSSAPRARKMRAQGRMQAPPAGRRAPADHLPDSDAGEPFVVRVVRWGIIGLSLSDGAVRFGHLNCTDRLTRRSRAPAFTPITCRTAAVAVPGSKAGTKTTRDRDPTWPS